MEYDKPLVTAVCKITIAPDDILFLITAMNNRHSQGDAVDWYTQLELLSARFPGDTARILSIIERMECLVAMLADPRLQPWAIDTTNGEPLRLSEPVYRATATTPLRYSNGSYLFAPDEFFPEVLRQAEAEAHT